MINANSAPGLIDVWNLFLAVASRQPIQLRVFVVLGVLVGLILIVDGIRANFRREQPQTLHIVRPPYASTRAMQAIVARDTKSRPLRAFKVKHHMKKLKPFKPPKPVIGRVSLAGSRIARVDEAMLSEPPRDQYVTAL